MTIEDTLAEMAASIAEIDIDILDLTLEREAWERKVRGLVTEAYQLGLSAGPAIGLVRDILTAACEKQGISLDSAAEPGTPARNYELADRLGIGHIFGAEKT